MNKATIKVLIAMLLWGSLGVFVKNISLDSVEIAFFRGIIGSVFLGIVLFIRMQNNKKLEQENDKLNNDFEDEDKKPSKKSIIILIISGMAIGLNWVFLFNSYNYITVANATIVYYLAPVIVIFVSPIFLKEKLTLKKVLSVICAMIGLVLIVRTGQSSGNINLTQGIIIIAILGIAHTGIAYCLYFSAMKELKAQSIAILGYLDPVSSVVFSIFLLREPFSIYQLIGGVIILLSAIIAEKNPKPKTIENGEINL